MKRFLRTEWVLLAIALAIPLFDLLLGLHPKLSPWRIGNETCQRVLIFAILGLGLNVVTGYTGLLHLGAAAFMAIGVYAYAILTCNVFPFQVGFWVALVLAPVISAGVGVLLGAPTLRLRGDYLAIVTLGFGEITVDVLKNVDHVTKGMQGINPLPPPELPGYTFGSTYYEPWYYFFLAILVLLVIVVLRLENSRLGRQWMSIREDELAATCMGINPVKGKLLAFAIGAAICGVGGVLWASKLETTAEPTSYDFTVSITVLCILIVGGMGSLKGVLVGAVVVMGFDILMKKVTEAMGGTGSVFVTPSSYKFMLFGLALILMMRFRPEGIFPSARIKEEMHREEVDPEVQRVGVE